MGYFFVPSVAHQIINGIKPIIVIANNWNHPDLFKSCNLLAPTAKTGTVVPNKTNTYATPQPLESQELHPKHWLQTLNLKQIN